MLTRGAHVSLTGSGDVAGGDNWLECHKRAAVKYKFFLAFEDAVCKDYVTEKLFSMFNGGIDMIPIVLGKHSSYRSYIDITLCILWWFWKKKLGTTLYPGKLPSQVPSPRLRQLLNLGTTPPTTL